MRVLKSAWLLFLAFVPAALAQGTYTQIDYPGAFSTQAVGIDDAGNISGWYEDQNTALHGFVLRNGNYISVDYPGTTGGTALYGMNNVGQVVGVGGAGPFFYDMNAQTFTLISYPNVSSTGPSAINNAGVVVGQVDTNKGLYGFALKGTKGTLIEPPGTLFATASGISTSGIIVGFASSPRSSTVNFEYVKGSYYRITIPDAASLQVYGIDPTGKALVGSYINSYGDYSGFVYRGHTLTPVQFNGAQTVASGINSSGQIVGLFGYLGAPDLHGFLWTPPADTKKNR